MDNNFTWRTDFAKNIFRYRYAQGPDDTWPKLCRRLVEDVCGSRNGKETVNLLSKEDRDQLIQYMIQMKFVPGGRYLYYAGRIKHFYNNCFAGIAEEDTREEWARLAGWATSCLMSGGGIGIEYSRLRPKGYTLKSTGGTSSGPLSLMCMINEIGRNVMQGGNRRSAIWAGLNWQHEDIWDFIKSKNYSQQLRDLKEADFNFPLQMDMTNVTVNWDTDFAVDYLEDLSVPAPDLWIKTVKQMMKTGEPGHGYNFYCNEDEIGRNACGEFVSDIDSNVCNLGSINFANIEDIEELADVTQLASRFLYCGTIRGEVPIDKIKRVRDERRQLGLGLMGIHEWLLSRGERYEVTDELKEWLLAWKECSEIGANIVADKFGLPCPYRYRSVAPAGTIGILASTTTGIEPLFAVAYKRRFLIDGNKHKYQYVIDATAQRIINKYDTEPSGIETASVLSQDIERHLAFQAGIQAYVDMGISSTINLPAWGTDLNNEDRVDGISHLLRKYALDLRGITIYPDGGRGGQPLNPVPYEEAKKHEGVVYDEEENKCSNGICGI